MSEIEPLLIARDGPVLRLTLNRPERRNALTNDLISQLTTALDEASADRTVGCVVLTGAGDRAFCAGADLTHGDTPFQFDFSEVHTPFANFLRAAKNCRAPIVGRVLGHCLAGGMGLYGACDIVIAGESARFGLPEAKVGIFPMQVLAVLRDVIPDRKLKEMCLTGHPLTAAEALQWGLVNSVVADADLDVEVDRVVASLAAVSPVAVRRGKYAMRVMETMSFDEMIAFSETQVAPMTMTQDAEEGRQAFKAKRAPVWPNR